MQRWCTKLRSLSISSLSRPSHPPPWRIRLLHSTPFSISRSPFPSSTVIPPAFKSLRNSFASPAASFLPGQLLSSSSFPNSFAVQVRNFSAKSKEKKWKKLTPTISKVKKIKMKGYSSYKRRFRLLSDGTIRRWREGKRHNAHLKSKEAKRRLRRPSTVPVAYAKFRNGMEFAASFNLIRDFNE
ncbi:hypothetical protein V2J09_014766 [Rumex salicifolius]